MGERGKEAVGVATRRAQHPRPVRGDPDLRPPSPIGRQVEDGVPQREVRRITVHQFTIRIPQRPDCGHRLLEPGHGFRPLHAVRFVALTFPGADPEDEPASCEEVHRRGGLRGDRGVAAAGVGHRHTQRASGDPVSSSQIAQHRPRLEIGIGRGQHLGAAAELRLPQRPREQRVEVVRHPERVHTCRDRGQVAGPGKRVDRRT